MSQNIIFIVLDSVRKDFFEESAVRIKDLNHISFDQCRAASSWTAASHASMISGLLPNEHMVTTHSRSFDSISRENTIFDDLDDYRTVGISANVYAGPTYNFDKFFDSFFVLSRETRFPKALTPSMGNYDMSFSGIFAYLSDVIRDDRTIQSALNGITHFLNGNTTIPIWAFDEGAKSGLRIAREELRNAQRPTFVFLNLMEGHIPYRSTRFLDNDLYNIPDGWGSDEKGVWELIQNDYDEQYWDWRNQLYRATIDYLDRCISNFIQSINDKTTVIVTSDHGDNLGTEIDEGLANHKSSLSEGLLHVPLYVINPPDLEPNSERYISQLNFPELIRGIKNGYITDLSSDQIFAELGGMSPGPNPEEEFEYYDRAIRCAYKKELKVVWDSMEYCTEYNLDLSKDSWQQRIGNLASLPSWALDGFEIDIHSFKAKAIQSKDSVDIDSLTANRLKELGYL